MNKFYIIGVGPGTEDYLLPLAKREIERSDCLIGARRVLSLFRGLKKEEVPLEGRLDEIIPYIKANREKKKLALLVSGDPGLYSFLERVSKSFKKTEYVVIPGISTMQLAFAKIGETWQDAKIVSLHGRGFGNLLKVVKASSKLFLFTDGELTPNKIASYLLKNKVNNRRAVVFENLSYPDERIYDTDLKRLSKHKGFKLCVMVIKK